MPSTTRRPPGGPRPASAKSSGEELIELEDWSCCDTAAYTSVAETMGLAVSAWNPVLAEAGLSYRGTVRVRHPLDVLVNDFGIDAIASRAVRSQLLGLALGASAAEVRLPLNLAPLGRELATLAEAAPV